MAILYLYSVILILLLSSVAWVFARRYGTWFDWDWLLCFLPTSVWFFLVLRGVGPQSEQLFMEAAAITGLVPLLLTFRVFVLDRLLGNARNSSLLILAVCTLSPVLLRFVMPPLLP